MDKTDADGKAKVEPVRSRLMEEAESVRSSVSDKQARQTDGLVRELQTYLLRERLAIGDDITLWKETVKPSLDRDDVIGIEVEIDGVKLYFTREEWESVEHGTFFRKIEYTPVLYMKWEGNYYAWNEGMSKFVVDKTWTAFDLCGRQYKVKSKVY